MHRFSRSPGTTRATSQHFWGCQRSSTMDYINIPTCALFRHGTMTVRLKMEVPNCCEPEVCPVKDCLKVVHRLSRCELCTRTRIISRISDCDSGKIVEKCRPYRSSTARSRYVNVCAAVCLLFLVGSLAPQSLAAPGPRTMSDEQEDPKWANPCDYASINNTTIKYYPKLAKDVALQARNALSYAESYKDEFAYKIHTYDSFAGLLADWKSYSYFWTQEFSWANVTLPQNKVPEGQLKDVVQKKKDSDEHYLAVPPEWKVFGSKVSDDYLEQLMTVIGDVLPSMFKSLKAVGAAMLSVANDNDLYMDINYTIVDGKTLQEKLNKTTYDVKAVLCVFSELMRSDKFKVNDSIPLLNSEVPRYKDNKKQALVVYLATLNYLEYLEQVFDKLNQTVL